MYCTNKALSTRKKLSRLKGLGAKLGSRIAHMNTGRLQGRLERYPYS
jgi:hypothetical protein